MCDGSAAAAETDVMRNGVEAMTKTVWMSGVDHDKVMTDGGSGGVTMAVAVTLIWW